MKNDACRSKSSAWNVAIPGGISSIAREEGVGSSCAPRMRSRQAAFLAPIASVIARRA